MKSRKADSPASYSDVQQVMDIAVEQDGLRYRCSSKGKAIHFRQRCNQYRNLMRSILQEQYLGVPGQRAQTAYDKLVISLINEEGGANKDGKTLLFRHQKPEGELFDADGNKIEIDIGVPPILGDDDA